MTEGSGSLRAAALRPTGWGKRPTKKLMRFSACTRCCSRSYRRLRFLSTSASKRCTASWVTRAACFSSFTTSSASFWILMFRWSTSSWLSRAISSK